MLPERWFSYSYFRQKLIINREEYFSKAHKAFQGTAESENANGTTFRRSIKTTQLMSDIYYVSSLLSKEKGEIAKAFLYARIHVKLGYRAWTTIELQQSKSMASRPLADMLSESESDDVAHQMANLSLAKREPSPVTSPKLASLNSVPFWSTLRRLYDGLVHLSQLFAHWGLFPEARYYMEQGLKFAEAAHAPSLKSQALSCLGDYLTRNGDVEQGIHLLKQADSMRSGLHIDPHTVLLQVFKAKSYTQDNDAKSVSDTFEYANQVLEQLSTNLVMKELNLQPVAAQDLSAEMTKLSLREGHPTRRPQTRERIASKKGGNKLAAGVKATTARGATIPFPGISILSRLKAVILREQASFATNIDKFELAASLFSEAAKVPVTPHDLMLNNLGAGRLYLCQAIEAMAADPIFCVLPESTTSQPCICVVRGRPGTSASERSPKKKVVGSPRKAPTKGASRDTKGKCASSPVLFADLLGQAHDNISSVYEHAKRAFSTPIVHSMADLLTRTLALISASTASQTKGAANSVFALYAMGELEFQISLNDFY
jgi:separase